FVCLCDRYVFAVVCRVCVRVYVSFSFHRYCCLHFFPLFYPCCMPVFFSFLFVVFVFFFFFFFSSRRRHTRFSRDWSSDVCSSDLLVIDSLKIYGEKRWPFKPFLLFIADQALHIAALLAVLLYEYGIPSEWQQLLLSPKAMLYAIAFVLVTAASPVMLRVFFSKWTKDLDFLHKHQNSLADAGLLIGIMERLLIVLFIQLNFLSGIGFLLGAKSIFRFGDLTNAKDTKFTEYILVGTLASFVVGIAIGYALRWGLRYVA